MKKTIDNIKNSIKYIDISKTKIIIIIIIGIISSLIKSIIPSINGKIINNLLKIDYQKVIVFAIIAGLFQILNTIFNYVINKNYLKMKEDITLNIRKKICQSLLDFKINNISEEGVGKLLNKIKKDSSNISDFFYNIKEGFLGLIFNIGIIIYIIYLNYIIGIYYLIVLIISIKVRYHGIKKSVYYQKKSIEESDENDNNISEIINGNKDIKINNLKEKFLKKNLKELKNISENLYQSNYSKELYNSIALFSESFFSGIMVILGIYLIKNNLLTTETFIIIFMYKGSVFLFPNKFAIIMNALEKFNISANRIYTILNSEKDNYGSLNVNIKGDITLENILFYYQRDNIILDNINLNIKRNSLTIIKGNNGIGKSTILNLITKVIDPYQGNIYLDKNNVKDLSENTIRKSITLISQQPYLFNFSIYDNLSIINNDQNQIEKVCKQVGIHKKILSFKEGYQTKIGSDACKLSGGEKQKLAIARALLTKSKILLMDEITNNLDRESIISIFNLLNKLKKKYTIVFITHNNEIDKYADKIITIVDNHTIKESP